MSDTVQKPSRVSREGVVLIKSFEGFRSRATHRADGRWVIGYGHTLSAREGLKVTEAEAELLLQYDLIPVVKAVTAVPATLNQHQFDALASFVFSIGVERFEASDVLASLTADAHTEAADALIAWPDDGVVNAPPRRRAAERALFVAAPEAPVTLVDLLAAPLPFPTAFEPQAFDEAPAAIEEDAAEDPAATDFTFPAPDEVAPFPPATTFDSAAPTPVAAPGTPAASAALAQLYSPYAFKSAGPLPGLGDAATASDATTRALAPANDIGVSARAPVELTPPALQVATDPSAQAIVAEPGDAAPTSFAATAASSVLTGGASEEKTASESAAPSDHDAPVLDAMPLSSPNARLDVRRKKRAKPARRFDWAETAPMFIMSLIGLVSLGAALAAFRRAAASGGDETVMIAWVLAIIAAACLGVSGFNLWQRWGRADRS